MDARDGASPSVQRRRRERRVVHLTTVHHPQDPRIFHKQLATLREAGYDVHFIAPRAQSATVDGVPITALPKAGGRYGRVVRQGPAYRAARALAADLYHIHDPELIPLVYLLKRVTGACVVYDMHEDYRWHGSVEGRLLRALERWCFSWVDHVVLAEASYRTIVAVRDVPTTVVANYVKPFDTAPVAPSTLDEPLRLLYTGVVAESRGLFHMIDLAEQIIQQEVEARLDVVGVCNLAAQHRRAERRIRERELEARVRRVGWDRYVPAAAMAPYYRRAHVGLALFDPHPNFVHSLPTKFFEYLYYGLPILCSDFPLWRRFVEWNACGAVVPPGDVGAALDMLQRWQSDPDRYRTLSKAARAASKRYRWDSEGARLVRLYDTLLDAVSP